MCLHEIHKHYNEIMQGDNSLSESAREEFARYDILSPFPYPSSSSSSLLSPFPSSLALINLE
jgi:hypothetical protein